MPFDECLANRISNLRDAPCLIRLLFLSKVRAQKKVAILCFVCVSWMLGSRFLKAHVV